MRKWHAEFGRGPWGRGPWGLLPVRNPNVGGGTSYGWWQVHVWWTRRPEMPQGLVDYLTDPDVVITPERIDGDADG